MKNVWTKRSFLLLFVQIVVTSEVRTVEHGTIYVILYLSEHQDILIFE
jgi:hypothetical protein